MFKKLIQHLVRRAVVRSRRETVSRCAHEYVLDHQILVIRCSKCMEQHSITVGNLWPTRFQQGYVPSPQLDTRYANRNRHERA